ncbi:hypothetical protein GCM10014715_56720 [Streptomyces spiralis]|uniref:Uncharacterized protein n=1 Tax=Streptomyces spiralis TaxID=66376 RepID=A0A919DY98_9ACTN|nr:hypothetical protein GCM10014715_56720 [Streptomyces spiralis]
MNGLLISAVSVLATLIVTAVFQPLLNRITAISRRITHIKPVSVHVETDPSIVWAGFPNWIPAFVWLPGRPTSRPPEHPTDWRSWAMAQGGAEAFQTALRVTVTARENASVVVDPPKVRHESHPLDVPPRGCIALCPVGGAAVTPRRLQVDLAMGTTMWVDEDGSPIAPLSLALSPGETEQFLIFVNSHSGRNQWHLELPILIDGKRLLIPIKDGSKPFITYGVEGFELYRWSDPEWERQDQL